MATPTTCVKCETWVGKGKPHNCSKNTSLENMSRMIKRVSPCTRQKLIGVALSKELQEAGESKQGGIIKIKAGKGRFKTEVRVGKQKVKVNKTRFNIQAMKKLQVAFDLTDKTLLGFARAHRVVHGRKSVEPGLQKSLEDRNKKFDDHFQVIIKMMKRKPTKAEVGRAEKGEIKLGPLGDDGCEDVKPVGVSAVSVDNLVVEVLLERGLKPKEWIF